MRIGKVEIQAVSDGSLGLDGGMMFGSIPKTIWSRRCPPDELNRVLLHLNCYLLLSQGRRILIDTGFGDKLNPKQQQAANLKQDGGILESLRRLGLAPEDIDTVVNTHLHIDHCGGNTCVRDGGLVPTFPRAQYCIQRLEWEAATNPNDWTLWQYWQENYVPLAEAGVLRLLDGDTTLTSEVRCIPTRGHTPGHQCIVIESEGEWAIILGDLAPLVPHAERTIWIPALDMEPLVNLETKRRIFQEVRDRNGLMFFIHDPKIQAGRMVERDGKPMVERVG